MGIAPWNEGKGWVPITGDSGIPFNGSYNGNNYKILNLTINRSDSSYVGLFGRTVAATITNVNLVNASVKGNSFVGVLSGLTIGSGDIRPLISENNISGNSFNGIRLDKDVAVDVIGNTISKTKGAIYLTDKSSATISNNTLTDNTDYGIQIYLATDSITISNNIIKKNSIGIDAYAKDKVTISGM